MDAIVDQLLKESLVKDGEGVDGQLVTEEDISRFTTAIMYGAGADTVRPSEAIQTVLTFHLIQTVSALETCILGLVMHPDVQKRAHEELDEILKLGRLPDFTDVEDLPYISAVVKEALRWNVVTPFGIAHRLTEDTVLSGYHIPKGTIVIPNAW